MRRGERIGNKKQPGNVIVFPGGGSGKERGRRLFVPAPPLSVMRTRGRIDGRLTARAGMGYADRMPPFPSNIVARRP